jgi:hypothetical protein
LRVDPPFDVVGAFDQAHVPRQRVVL